MLTISTMQYASIVQVGMVDGCGYDGRQEDAICDVRESWQTIQSMFKPVFRWFRLIGYAYKLLRCLDLEIWRFSWWQQMDRHVDWLLYPCACMRGNYCTFWGLMMFGNNNNGWTDWLLVHVQLLLLHNWGEPKQAPHKSYIRENRCTYVCMYVCTSCMWQYVIHVLITHVHYAIKIVPEETRKQRGRGSVHKSRILL